MLSAIAYCAIRPVSEMPGRATHVGGAARPAPVTLLELEIQTNSIGSADMTKILCTPSRCVVLQDISLSFQAILPNRPRDKPAVCLVGQVDPRHGQIHVLGQPEHGREVQGLAAVVPDGRVEVNRAPEGF